jgi:hypothetical protein
VLQGNVRSMVTGSKRCYEFWTLSKCSLAAVRLIVSSFANWMPTEASQRGAKAPFVMADERSRWDRMCPLIWADDWFVDYFWLALTMLRADWVKLTQKSRQEGFHVWLAARRPDGRIGSFSDVCDDIANQTSQ